MSHLSGRVTSATLASMESRLRMVGLCLILWGPAVAHAADPTCHTYDRSPTCCPHPPPQCCPPAIAQSVDDAVVAEVCGGAGVPKGESTMLGECRRYYAHDDFIGEVLFGRQTGDAAAFDKVRAQLTSPRGQVSTVTVQGAQHAFVVRAVTETGALERTSAWALVGNELFHVEAEVAACTAPQVEVLLGRAIARLREEKNMKTTSMTPKRPRQ